jgi:hypothetical protein
MYLFIRIVFYKLLCDKLYFLAIFVIKTISTSTWDYTPDKIMKNKKKNDGKRSSFCNIVLLCFFFFLEYQMMYKFQKPSNPECYGSSDPLWIQHWIAVNI